MVRLSQRGTHRVSRSRTPSSPRGSPAGHDEGRRPSHAETRRQRSLAARMQRKCAPNGAPSTRRRELSPWGPDPRFGERPDLVAHLEVEPLSWVGVGGSKGLGPMLDNTRRTIETHPMPKQPSAELEVVVPEEELSLGQTDLSDGLCLDEQRHEGRRAHRHAPHGGSASQIWSRRARARSRGVHRVIAAIGPHDPTCHRNWRGTAVRPHGP